MNEKEKKLSKEELFVLREGGTEVAGTGIYLHESREGNYMCKYCDNPLFSSETKFESGTGWPSFDKALPGAIREIIDTSYGMERTEIVCARCNSHLGHVFNDGQTDTGMRYCMNSVCLLHEKDK